MGTSAVLGPIRERTERLCLALARAELDVAFSYLRLAEAELRGGNLAHAQALVGKARMTYLSALRYADSLPAGSDMERCELSLVSVSCLLLFDGLNPSC